MKQTKTLFLLFLFSSSLFLTDCKKGEDDPLISLRSRKARVVGKWTLTSGTYKSTSFIASSGSSSAITGSYTETSYVYSNTNSGGTTSNSFSYKRTIEFKKDGGFINTVTENGSTSTTVGTWNFTGGVGEIKKKEQIVINYSSHTYPTASWTFSGNSTDETFDINELRNKKLVLSTEDNSSYSNGDKGSNSETYTFEQ